MYSPFMAILFSESKIVCDSSYSYWYKFLFFIWTLSTHIALSYLCDILIYAWTLSSGSTRFSCSIAIHSSFFFSLLLSRSHHVVLYSSISHVYFGYKYVWGVYHTYTISIYTQHPYRVVYACTRNVVKHRHTENLPKIKKEKKKNNMNERI